MAYVAVNAHELAHQWFGDYVTALTIRIYGCRKVLPPITMK